MSQPSLSSSSSSSSLRRLSMWILASLLLLLILHSPSGSSKTTSSPPSLMMAHAWTTTTTIPITTTRKQRRIISSSDYYPPFHDHHRRFVVILGAAKDHDHDNYYEDDDDDDLDDASKMIVPRNITQLAETKVRLAAAAAAAQAQEQQQRQLGEDTTDGTAETKKKEAAATHPLYQSVKQQLQPQQLQDDAGVDNVGIQSKRRNNMLSKDECNRILQVHSNYYRAFARKDSDMMTQQVWGGGRGSGSVCIHPGHRPILGSGAISKSWQDLLETTARGAHQKTWIEPWNIRLVVTSPTMAVITCDEHVYSRRFVRGHPRQTQLEQVLQATHIFRRHPSPSSGDEEEESSSWYMMYHHSSWHANSELSKLALKDQQQQQEQQHEQSPSSSTTTTTAAPGGGVAPGVASSGPLVIRGSAEEVVESLAGLLSGAGVGSKKLLNFDTSETADDDDGEEDEDEDEEELLDSIIIKTAMNDDNDDDDDGDEDTPEIDENDDNNNAMLNIQIRKRDARRFQSLTPSQKREECISTLRQLAKEGHITSSQKRILLTDIIRSSSSSSSSSTTATTRTTLRHKKPAQGLRPPPLPHHSMSLVEVAYDLFYCETRQEKDDSDRLEEAKLEFAEQCRVFANSLEIDGGVSRRR